MPLNNINKRDNALTSVKSLNTTLKPIAKQDLKIRKNLIMDIGLNPAIMPYA